MNTADPFAVAPSEIVDSSPPRATPANPHQQISLTPSNGTTSPLNHLNPNSTGIMSGDSSSSSPTIGNSPNNIAELNKLTSAVAAAVAPQDPGVVLATKLLPVTPPFIYQGHNKNDNTNPIPTNEKLQDLLKETLASPGRTTALSRFLKYTEPLPPVIIDGEDSNGSNSSSSSTSSTSLLGGSEDPYSSYYSHVNNNHSHHHLNKLQQQRGSSVKIPKNGKGFQMAAAQHLSPHPLSLPHQQQQLHDHQHPRQEIVDDIDPLQFFLRQAHQQRQLPPQFQQIPPDLTQQHQHVGFYTCCSPNPLPNHSPNNNNNTGATTFATLQGSTPATAALNPSALSLSLSANGYYQPFPASVPRQLPPSLPMNNNINNNTLGNTSSFYSSSDFSAAILAGIHSNTNNFNGDKSNIKRASMDHDMTHDPSSASNNNCNACIETVSTPPSQVQSTALIPALQQVVPTPDVSNANSNNNNMNNNNNNNNNNSGGMVSGATNAGPSTAHPVPLLPRPDEEFVYLTEEFLNLPQSEAARKLGVPTSSLSKKWKEVAGERKWPYRTVCKLDKEIATLIEANTSGRDAPTKLPPDVEQTLGLLIRRRSQELKTVLIRLKKKDYLTSSPSSSSSTGS